MRREVGHILRADVPTDFLKKKCRAVIITHSFHASQTNGETYCSIVICLQTRAAVVDSSNDES